jgi:H+/Cl- antiporter ClcA
MENWSHKINIWKPFKGIIGGVILVILAFILSPRYLGLGVNSIEAAINGSHIPALAFLWKILFTSITLSTGGSGGILTPIFFIGTSAGSTFAHIFNLNPAIFTSIGMVALLAGAANTPIAASVMAIEIFGPQIGSYAAIACIVSYTAAGHRSVYSSQLLGITKSSSINAPLMKDFKNLDGIEVENRPGKIIYLIKMVWFNKIKKENSNPKQLQ